MRWSPDGSHIASGGNDNKLVVYSHKQAAELVKFHEHKAAVKAIGWCPSSPSILASGGGTADRHIRFFSTNTLEQSFAIDTGKFLFKFRFPNMQSYVFKNIELNGHNTWVQFEPNKCMEYNVKLVRKFNKQNGYFNGPYISCPLLGKQPERLINFDRSRRLNTKILERI